jgi:hypothetical protein
MALCWDVGISINMAEFAFGLMLMKSSLAIKKAFNNERLNQILLQLALVLCMNLTISNLDANTFDLLRQLAPATIQEAQFDLCELKHLARTETTFDIQSTDATTNWNVEEDLLSKDLFDLPPKSKALFDLLVVAIISVIAFVYAFADQRESQLEAKGLKYLTINQNVLFEFWFAVRKPRLADKLVILVECKSRLTDKIEFAEHNPRPAGNSFDEVTGTFTARDWAIHDNPPNGQIVEKGTQADVKLRGLAEHKCAFWFVMVVACDNPLELRHQDWVLLAFAIDFGNCHSQ